MLLFHGRRTPSNVRLVLGPNVYTDIFPDINSELDELDREEFYRLKKVSNKKQRDQQEQDAELLKQRKQKEENGQNGEQEDGAGPVDVLGEHEDDDVIF